MAGTITEVTDTNFQAEVIESETPVLVDFWAPWCGPCRVVAPVLEEIAGEREDLRIVKLNVDENQQTAANFEVLSIPTLILFKDGQVAKKVIGAYPKKRLEAELEPALPSACARSRHTARRASHHGRRRAAAARARRARRTPAPSRLEERHAPARGRRAPSAPPCRRRLQRRGARRPALEPDEALVDAARLARRAAGRDARRRRSSSSARAGSPRPRRAARRGPCSSLPASRGHPPTVGAPAPRSARDARDLARALREPCRSARPLRARHGDAQLAALDASPPRRRRPVVGDRVGERPRRRGTPRARARRRAAPSSPPSASAMRSSTARPGGLARALHGVHDLARQALAAQLVVERELERHRVRALALELVALQRLQREQQVVGAPARGRGRRPRCRSRAPRAARAATCAGSSAATAAATCGIALPKRGPSVR